MKVTIRLYFTTSKFAAYLILIIGTIYSFWVKDSEVLIFTFSLASGLLGLKTWNEGLIKRKQIENNIPVI